jgi:serine protease AprX
MRNEGLTEHGVRTSALWGKRPGSRDSALWGKGGRGMAALFAIVVMFVAPAAGAETTRDYRAYVTPNLLEQAQDHPAKQYRVIVTSNGSTRGPGLINLVAREAAKSMSGSSSANEATVKSRVKRQFRTVSAVALTLSGKQILRVANMRGIESITLDAPVELAGYSNKQLWAQASGVSKLWPQIESGQVKLPTIAIVDSGIEENRSDFAPGQVLLEKNLSKLANNSVGDGRGHGTFVAGIASGVAPGYAGAAPKAPIVSLDVMDDTGMALTSDVIAAADWIYLNKDLHNIRVANFSLHSGAQNSFMYDPLNKAVEKLWFSGVVVVAAAGNYGKPDGPSGVPFAPGNDPFVITVGAVDLGEKLKPKDDRAAPWSAYGYTLDGFAKPEIAAPGRYMIGPVPATSTLLLERPGQARGVGYMELSGTSFAAPLVAGMAAYLLGANPTWTPDQVKGALMVTAGSVPMAAPGSVGVGEAVPHRAAAVKNPPNPNLALNAFLVADPTGVSTPVFDAASWANTATADASWASASWASASWASASWASASWASASWASASWASASWANASWAAASWAAASWASSSYEDNAEGEGGIGGILVTEEEESLLEALYAAEETPTGVEEPPVAAEEPPLP